MDRVFNAEEDPAGNASEQGKDAEIS